MALVVEIVGAFLGVLFFGGGGLKVLREIEEASIYFSDSFSWYILLGLLLGLNGVEP